MHDDELDDGNRPDRLASSCRSGNYGLQGDTHQAGTLRVGSVCQRWIYRLGGACNSPESPQFLAFPGVLRAFGGSWSGPELREVRECQALELSQCLEASKARKGLLRSGIWSPLDPGESEPQHGEYPLSSGEPQASGRG